MDIPTVAQLASQFGMPGVVVGYLIWRESNDRKDRRDETESRLKLASALESLKTIVIGRNV